MAFVTRTQTTKNNNMKKQIFALASIVMIAGAMTFTSCNQEDITAPVITISGGNAVDHTLNAAWTNPSATATDDEDGDLTSSISVSGVVDPNLVGTYTLTYTVSDAAGNTATETVTVNVKNSAQFFAGTYSADDTCQQSTVFPYNSVWTASTTVNNDLNINNFGGFGTSYDIDADWNGSNTLTVSVPQTIGSIGSLTAVNCTYTASGTTVNATIIYTWTDGTNTETCTSTYSK